MFEIYKLLQRLEKEIGNGAHVELHLEWGLVVRVSWPNNWHFQIEYIEENLNIYSNLEDIIIGEATSSYNCEMHKLPIIPLRAIVILK
jgi:hypothetical protein